MPNRIRAIFVPLVLGVCGCQGIRTFYQGSERPRETISILVRGNLEVNILEVNGFRVDQRDWPLNGPKELHLEPGVIKVRATYFANTMEHGRQVRIRGQHDLLLVFEMRAGDEINAYATRIDGNQWTIGVADSKTRERSRDISVRAIERQEKFPTDDSLWPTQRSPVGTTQRAVVR
jgi:hypothetical protein